MIDVSTAAADRFSAEVCDAIADINEEFDCGKPQRRVLERIEMTLDQVPDKTLRRLATLDEAMGGAVAAMLRARLLLAVAGSRETLDAATFFAELQAVSDRIVSAPTEPMHAFVAS